MRWFRAIVASVLLLFGLACLNYTKPGGLEHHREVARQQGWPPPSNMIVYGGAAAIVCGAMMAGYAIGSKRRG